MKNTITKSVFILWRIKFLGDGFQKVADGEVLRTDAFTAAATDTVRGFAVSGCEDGVVVEALISVEEALPIHAGEEVGDQDILRAMVFFYAVVAGGAGDEFLLVEDFCHFTDGCLFFFGEGFEVLHKASILLHLLETAHSREDDGDLREACSKADSILCVGMFFSVRLEGIEDGLTVIRKIHKLAAFYRLHDEDGFIMLCTDLVYFAAFNGRVFIIGVIELNLHDFHLGVFGEDLIKHVRLIVEGDAEVPDAALFFKFKGGFIGMDVFEFGEGVSILGVHQIKVEVVNATGLQLGFQQGMDILIVG